MATVKPLNINSLLSEVSSPNVYKIGNVDSSFFSRLNFPSQSEIIDRKIIEVNIRYKIDNNKLKSNIEEYKNYILSLYPSKNLNIQIKSVPNKNYTDLIIK